VPQTRRLIGAGRGGRAGLGIGKYFGQEGNARVNESVESSARKWISMTSEWKLQICSGGCECRTKISVSP
jgi:hypothetical protein